MEVKIGIQHAAREVVVDVDLGQDEVEQLVRTAIEEGSPVSLSDAKGRRVLVPGAHIAYVELGGGVTGTVGFR
ncbi:DUF3107 domain-containing protein [Nocardioides solisilvae]|uniref:DUF3107 domain-containing protein n=1 Tax=Nocardioides solisilvae TaxID=1542435 RepID=UPI000D749D8B|nr:DUF3107 domain-containing protein [Nocardioides solisilvae]